MSDLPEALSAVSRRVALAAQAAGRSAEAVQLIAVSKTQSADVVRAAFSAGQRAFGENYVQEALPKMVALGELPIEWHFIGPIQSNKTRSIATRFAWVHSVDRVKVAERLSQAREGLGILNVCLQINLSGEETKSGVAPADAFTVALAIRALPNLRLRGLMTLPQATPEATAQRAAFSALRRLRDQLSDRGFNLDVLSMGMSGDFEAAIHEGATHVRIGSALFGAREAVAH